MGDVASKPKLQRRMIEALTCTITCALSCALIATYGALHASIARAIRSTRLQSELSHSPRNMPPAPSRLNSSPWLRLIVSTDKNFNDSRLRRGLQRKRPCSRDGRVLSRKLIRWLGYNGSGCCAPYPCARVWSRRATATACNWTQKFGSFHERARYSATPLLPNQTRSVRDIHRF